MKLFRSLAVTLITLIPMVTGLAVLMASFNRACADELPAIVTSELEGLEKKRLEGLAQARKPYADLMEKYLEALNRAGEAARAGGDQRQLRAIEDEIKRMNDRAGDFKPFSRADPQVNKLRATYYKHRSIREADVLGMVIQVERDHADSLAEMVDELKQAGMMAEAKQVAGLEENTRAAIKSLDQKFAMVQGFAANLKLEKMIPASMKMRCSKANRMARLRESGGTPECEEAVVQALNWLKQTQSNDGSWTADYPAAMTGFALLALLGHCETPLSPEYGANVLKAITYLVNLGMQNNGRLTTKPVSSNVWVYEHAIATYALCEAYTYCSKLDVDIPELENVTRKAVKMIMDGQGESGGWVYRYAPTKVGDNSVGFWQIQALAAARHTGLFRESELTTVARKALDWLDKAQGKDGSIGYRGDSKQSPGLTGGGVLAFQMWDMVSSRNARAGIDYISKNTGFKWGDQSANLYHHYYNSQAMLNYGGAYWVQYNRLFRDELLKCQQRDGSWVQTGVSHGPANTHMATCLATLMLEVYYRYVPDKDFVR